MTTPREAAETLERVRAQAPLIHNITNYVVMNTTANALYAVGASPAMIHSPDEVEDFLALSQGLVINIGTISSPWLAGMKLAAHSARQRGVPWVLDPVGMGATRYRNQAARDLALLGPTAIRGNASEIMALPNGPPTPPRGSIPPRRPKPPSRPPGLSPARRGRSSPSRGRVTSSPTATASSRSPGATGGWRKSPAWAARPRR